MAVLGFCTKSRSLQNGEEEHRSCRREEGDARLLDHSEAKRKEWAKHWQCDESVQNLEEKPWENEELTKLEEARPRLRPEVPVDLTKETRGEVVKLLETVEQSGKMAAASLHNDVVFDSEKCHE